MPPGACISAVVATSTLGAVPAKAPGQAISKRERRPWSAGGMPMPMISVVMHSRPSVRSQAAGRDVPQRGSVGYTALPADRSGHGTSVSGIAVDDLPLRSELSPYVRSVSGRNPAMPGRVGAARLPAPPRHCGVLLALMARRCRLPTFMAGSRSEGRSPGRAKETGNDQYRSSRRQCWQ